MRNLRMLDILKRIGTGIILSLFVVSTHEDSFALSFERSENFDQGTISGATIIDHDSDRDYWYNTACGNQHSGRLPCGDDCQFSECRDAIVPWKWPSWKKYSVQLPFSGTTSVFRPSVLELVRNPDSGHPSSDIPDKNSYTSLIGIIKNLN